MERICANIFYGWNELTFSGQNRIECQAGMGRVRSMLRFYSFDMFVLTACSSILCHWIATFWGHSRRRRRNSFAIETNEYDELGIWTIVVNLRESNGKAKLFHISYIYIENAMWFLLLLLHRSSCWLARSLWLSCRSGVLCLFNFVLCRLPWCGYGKWYDFVYIRARLSHSRCDDDGGRSSDQCGNYHLISLNIILRRSSRCRKIKL